MPVPRRACDAKRASRSSTFSSLARQRARGRFRDFREENVMPVANGRRVAVIAGCRTPFCRSGTVLKDARAVDLARFVARELLERTNLDDADVVLAGGVESLSDIPILASRRLADILVEASKAKSLGSRLRTLSRIRPRDLIPVSPAIAEPSTGESMGQSAEKMAKENHIS